MADRVTKSEKREAVCDVLCDRGVGSVGFFICGVVLVAGH